MSEVEGGGTPQDIQSDVGKNQEKRSEFLPNPESFPLLAKESEQVRVFAEKVSTDFKEPLVVFFNASAGTIYSFGINSISTQFNRQKLAEAKEKGVADPDQYVQQQRDEFTKDWLSQFKERSEDPETKKFPGKTRKASLIETASKWINDGKLIFLVIPEIDCRYSSATGPTRRTHAIEKALKTATENRPSMYVDWSDLDKPFPDSHLDIQNHPVRASSSQIWLTNWDKNPEDKLFIGKFYKEPALYSKRRIKGKTLSDCIQSKFKKVTIFLSPFHTWYAHGVFEENNTPTEKDFRKIQENYRSGIRNKGNIRSAFNWLMHFPAGTGYRKALRIIEDEDFASMWLDPFLDQSEDLDKRIQLCDQAFQDGIKGIRELQVDENGDNYYQRRDKNKIKMKEK